MKKHENSIKEAVNELFIVVKRIQKGKKHVDFMIESENDGIDRYCSTPLEKEFVKATRKILKLINEDRDVLTFSIYKQIIEAFDNSYKARGSFRGRTPAYGGDWQDIESPVEWECNAISYDLKRIAKK